MDEDSSNYVGYLSCFCTQQKTNEGTDYSSTTEYTDVNGENPEPICETYDAFYFKALAIGQAITFFLVIVNKLLTTLSISMITWIGYDTHSEMLTKITNGVFIAQFFNTAIVLLLVSANFQENFTPLKEIFTGPFVDYMPKWYSAVGYVIVQTMIINAFFPVVFQCIADVQKWVFQKLDSRRGKDDTREEGYVTKKTQIFQYIELYSGPSYIVHFKYSSVFNVTFVTMMYGVGLPILFPIAVMNYFIFYFLERYHMARTYQLPPSLDDRLTKNAIKVLKFAPLLLLANGAWMLSNLQIFDGVFYNKETSSDVALSGHNFASLFAVTQASPVVLMVMIMFTILILQNFFKKQLKSWGFAFSAGKIEVDENLPNFFNAIKLSESDWICKENDYYNKTYKMRFIPEELQARFDDTKTAKKPIQGIHWYNLLANPSYVQDFSYISCSIPDREDYIVDDDSNEDNDNEQSDLVALVLNLAYVDDKVVNDLEIKTGFSLDLKVESVKKDIGEYIHDKLGDSKE